MKNIFHAGQHAKERWAIDEIGMLSNKLFCFLPQSIEAILFGDKCKNRRLTVFKIRLELRNVFGGRYFTSAERVRQLNLIHGFKSTHLLRGQFDRIDNMLIAGTTTKISGKRMTDFIFRRIWIRFQEWNKC